MSILFIAIHFIFSKGSCLEYGHSCWGAHGKRSGLKTVQSQNINDALFAEEPTSNPVEKQLLDKYFLLNFLIDKVRLHKRFFL